MKTPTTTPATARPKKLALARETLRRLDARDLTQVAGGYSAKCAGAGGGAGATFTCLCDTFLAF